MLCLFKRKLWSLLKRRIIAHQIKMSNELFSKQRTQYQQQLLKKFSKLYKINDDFLNSLLNQLC